MPPSGPAARISCRVPGSSPKASRFVQGEFERETVLSLSNLGEWAPDARYMLAMKCISARWDTSDRDDVVFLIERLGLERAEDVLELVESYYPAHRIPPRTRFLIEERFERSGDAP